MLAQQWLDVPGKMRTCCAKYYRSIYRTAQCLKVRLNKQTHKTKKENPILLKHLNNCSSSLCSTVLIIVPSTESTGKHIFWFKKVSFHISFKAVLPPSNLLPFQMAVNIHQHTTILFTGRTFTF